MPVVKKQKTVNYSPAQMYALVNHIESYPEFLPWCSDAIVHFRREDEAQATLVISAKGYSKSFTTHNHLQKDKMIEIRLVDGPFKHLEGFWRFDPVGENQCLISFDLEFDFIGALISQFVSPMFSQISDAMVDAFTDRAGVLYGN